MDVSGVSVARSPSIGINNVTQQAAGLINRVNAQATANSAFNAQQAADLRNWQETQNRIAMDYNAREAAKNRNWQEMMSNTAHQREVADLKAAGLNPVLSASGGNGAAVGSGATAAGVTSAGAKGDADTSANQAIVNLLGAMYTAQQNLAATAMTATANQAIADKNNSTSKLINELTNMTNRDIAKIYTTAGIKQSEIGAAASMYGAQQSAGAVLGAAATNAQMQRYLAENNPNTWPGFFSAAVNGAGQGFFGKSGVQDLGAFFSKTGVNSAKKVINRIKSWK